MPSYWSTNPRADWTNIEFSRWIPNVYTKTIKKRRSNQISMNQFEEAVPRKSWQNRKTVKNVNTDTTSLPTCGLTCWSKSPLALQIQRFGTPTTATSTTLRPSPSIPSVNPFFGEVCYDTSHFTSKFTVLEHLSFAELATICFRNIRNLRINHRPTYYSRYYNRWEKFFLGRRQWHFLSSGCTVRIFQMKQIPLSTQEN